MHDIVGIGSAPQQLAQEMLDIRQDISIIICTGFSEKMDQEKAKKIGIKGLLMKPVIKSVMANIARKVLDEAQGIDS